MPTIVYVDGHKYGFVMRDDGTIANVLRNEEDWPSGLTFIHSGVVLALVQEVQELRAVLQRRLTDEDKQEF